MGANIILAVGAIVIFGTFLSSSNRLMTGNTQIAEQNEYYITALSLAQSVINEAKTKAFDEKVLVSAVPSADSMTAPGSLGKDAGESVPNPDVLTTASPFSSASPGFRSSFEFDDIDDYRNYNRLVNTPRAEGYRINVSMTYASATYPDSAKNQRTYCKRMTVNVMSPFIPDTIKLSYAFTY
ncbi:MAG: hypothetical protein HY033_12630 [Ignavibacteriae bacterium]|nr:hypothetical protein [Ignavibacteria bacterium]MBI3365739.1 hypothetical protein [Ignavibacteriota bacterium]